MTLAVRITQSEHLHDLSFLQASN